MVNNDFLGILKIKYKKIQNKNQKIMNEQINK
jgi:hypothetical protein